MDNEIPDAEARRALGVYQSMRRLVPAVVSVLMFVTLLFGQATFPPATFVHEFLEMIGVLLIFLGIVGRLWATLYIGGRKSDSVVTGGPYSITRNPLYVFSTMAAVGVGAQMGSIVVTVAFGVVCAAAFHLVILREEKFLKKALGEPYKAYLDRVPRFIPNFSLYQEGDTGSFKPRLLLNTLLDGLVFLVALPFFEVIDSAQASGTVPVLFHLP